MKTRLLGMVFAICLMLTPVLASASPMDGSYVGFGEAAAGIFTFTFDPYTVDIGADMTAISVDMDGAVLPSADILAGVDEYSPVDGVSIWLESDSVIKFESTLSSFFGSGSLTFSNLDPVLGFMHLVFSASGTTDYFSQTAGDTPVAVLASGEFDRQAATPVPAAIWLLGSGLIGLVGLRKQRYKA